MNKLKQIISTIDRKGYRAYKKLKGSYSFDDFTLFIDHVQGDPFASPSRLRVRVNQSIASFSRELFSSKSRKTALEDYISRAFAGAAKKISRGNRGTGKSGLIIIDSGKQEILQRTSCKVNTEFVEIRFYAGLPARGRTILGNQCMEMLAAEIPEIVKLSLISDNLYYGEIKKHVEVCEDQDHIRSILSKYRLVSFIKNGSILPRRSGISDCPLPESEAVAFKSPPELEVTLETPNSGEITGMGVPEGVTLIIGGGFHGKSTLLKAIERSMYNHIPGDGREYVVTVNSAFKIRAEEGRNIQKVNISSFISNLPFGRDTVKFSTSNASGSTSQAANIIEALECGAKLLLIDEDTSATNFLIRDEIMQKVVPKDKEPITPFIDRVREIYQRFNTSSIMVMGGSGDYFGVADNIIMMDCYAPFLITKKAKKIMKERKDVRAAEAPSPFGSITSRIPLPSSINPFKGNKKKIKSKGLDNIIFGFHNIDLSAVEQIVDPSQVNAISSILLYALDKKYINGKRTLSSILDMVFNDIELYGLDTISVFEKGQHPGSYALPRKLEAAAAINRLRILKVLQKT
jgi:predicted ABC-class ATPase